MTIPNANTINAISGYVIRDNARKVTATSRKIFATRGLTAPTNMMTPATGKVKKVSQGNAPKALAPSFNASSIKIDATSGIRIGKNPKSKPA